MEVPLFVVTLLRLIHIVAAFVWFGLGFAFVFYVYPAAAAAGEGGLRVLRVLEGLPGAAMLLPASSGLTMLAGLLLYATGSPERFTQLGNAVLGIGALAGIAAGIHGGAVMGRASKAFGQELAQAPESNIPADRASALQAQVLSIISHGRISFVLMVIALIGMASARYL